MSVTIVSNSVLLVLAVCLFWLIRYMDGYFGEEASRTEPNLPRGFAARKLTSALAAKHVLTSLP